MLAVAIEDLKVRLGNLNLPSGKNVICFEPLAQKGETGIQTAGILYYQYSKSVL